MPEDDGIPTQASPAPPARDTPAQREGVVAGRYRLTALTGQGRQATVFQADDLRIGGRRVAVKLAHPAAPASEHLLREARALAPLTHPAVPRLLDVGHSKGRLLLVLDYLPGRTLADVAAEGPIPTEDALEWALRLCDVVFHLHGRQQPLAHGAVSAEHCMLLPSGRLALFDFGTAAPATDTTRRQDALGVVDVLCLLLAGRAPQQAVQEPPCVGAGASSAALAHLGRWLQQSMEPDRPLTIAAIRRQLLECRQELGLDTGICPYCQAVSRAAARHCNTCGSPIARAPLAHAVPADLGAPAGAAAVPPTETASYQTRLRALGRLIDRDSLWNVAIEEQDVGFALSGNRGEPRETEAGGMPRLRSERVVRAITAADLVEMSYQAPQNRSVPTETVHRAGAGHRPGNPLFPTGYEDGLRALGYQLDRRGSLAALSIRETPVGLQLDYTLRAAEGPGDAGHRQLVLTVEDMESVLAESVERRGTRG